MLPKPIKPIVAIIFALLSLLIKKAATLNADCLLD